jgi:hypothetical protein
MRISSLIERIISISRLEDGWLDGQGSKFSQEDLNKTQAILISLYHKSILIPYVYPSPDNCIQFEWDNAYPDIAIDFFNRVIIVGIEPSISISFDFDIDEIIQKIYKEIA